MNTLKERLFSVVVPVYNVESYLEETVASILPQLADRGELLLIDDGSTDSSGVLCDRLAAQAPDKIRVIHKENEGLLLTRRCGFRQAQGQYIINCDSDDTLEPGMLDALENTIRATGADVILYNLNSWNPPQKQPFSQDLFATDRPDKEAALRAYFHHAGVVSMCAKCFRRSCLELSKDYSFSYKKSFGEDTMQSAEIFTNAKSFAYINKAFYNYRTGSGMTGKVNLSYFADFAQVNAYLEQYAPIWQLPDFSALLAKKIFTNAARAITQCRTGQVKRAARHQMMDEIRQHPMLQKYLPEYPNVRPTLKKSYRLVLDQLLHGRYWVIDLSLWAKDLLK